MARIKSWYKESNQLRKANEYKRPMYLLVAGSRTFSNYHRLEMELDKFISEHPHEHYIIVEGGAKGADTFARVYAKNHGHQWIEFPAKWNELGKRAGYVRNEEMHKYISQFQFRAVICFWDGQSIGTSHNFQLSKSYHNDLHIIRY